MCVCVVAVPESEVNVRKYVALFSLKIAIIHSEILILSFERRTNFKSKSPNGTRRRFGSSFDCMHIAYKYVLMCDVLTAITVCLPAKDGEDDDDANGDNNIISYAYRRSCNEM